MRQVLVDTEPLVALLRSQDQFHHWTVTMLAHLNKPLLTCEPVITEACFLLRNTYFGQEAVLSLIEQEVVQVAFRVHEEFSQLSRLITRYRSVPMSLADACLVRMAKQDSHSAILTLDSDFTIYRKNSNQTIPVIMPENDRP